LHKIYGIYDPSYDYSPYGCYEVLTNEVIMRLYPMMWHKLTRSDSLVSYLGCANAVEYMHFLDEMGWYETCLLGACSMTNWWVDTHMDSWLTQKSYGASARS